MKKVLILGAGLISKPMADYLLQNGYYVTIASNTKDRADAILKNHPDSQSVYWEADDNEALDNLVAAHDLVVSLLPYAFHPMVAKLAIKHKKNMVTASYVKPEMQALDEEAKKAGIIILNEVGLDPGIDHMSAKRIIDAVHDKNGEIEEFYSLCGALPAIEVACQNPFKYKFSWSPMGVLMAGNNDAKFKLRGEARYIPSEMLFKSNFYVNFPSIGMMEVYPNRDSVQYEQLYNIPEAQTIYRGTLRYPGWSQIIDNMKRLGLFSEETVNAENMTYKELMLDRVGQSGSKCAKKEVAKYLGIPETATTINALYWLGFFDDKKIGVSDKLINITGKLMIDKMMLEGNERDMVLMIHMFKVKYPDGKTEVIRSHMIDYGTPDTDTSIARTVSLPAAAAVMMILEGKIDLKGVHIPVHPQIYNPILDKLEELGIKMVEEFGLPQSEMYS